MSTKLKFFLFHLSISLIVILIASFIVFFLWYPSPFAKALGVTPLFIMLFIIDIIIGPLFTLLVYKSGKKTLKFDLAVIILLQVAALSYGMYAIAQGRPTWIVYETFVFSVVKNSDIERKGIEKAEAQFQEASWMYPSVVALQSTLPVKKKSFLEYINQEKSSALARYPIYYTDLKNTKDRLKMNVLPLSLLDEYNDKNFVHRVLGNYPDADAWLPLSAPVQDMVVLINKEKGEVVKIVDLRPWN